VDSNRRIVLTNLNQNKNNPRVLPKDRTQNLDPAQLRRLAEEIAGSREREDLEQLSPEDVRLMLHELHVHQIELEMQNEELHRAWIELDFARARYFDLFDLAPIGYCTISEKGLILEANFLAARLLGVTRDKMVKAPFSQFIFKEDQDVFYLCRKKLLETAESQDFDLRLIKNDATVFWARIEATLSQDNDGAPVVRVAMSDINARKLAEEALKIANDELEQKVQERTADLEKSNEALKRSNASLEDFAHVASHDLQEPLRKIRTFGDRLANVKVNSMTEQEVDYLARIQQAAARMQILIHDLLKYSRVTSSMEHFKVINLRNPVEEAVRDLSLLPEETEGTIDIGDLPEVKANANQMRQLFLNLIGNALKYRSNLKPLIRIHSSALSEEGFHEIHVEDNGMGFDEMYLDKIFKPFHRLHGRNSLYPGTGMGLAICRKIVELHGGTITAKSEPGKGSTFIVRLPKIN